MKQDWDILKAVAITADMPQYVFYINLGIKPPERQFKIETLLSLQAEQTIKLEMQLKLVHEK